LNVKLLQAVFISSTQDSTSHIW